MSICSSSARPLAGLKQALRQCRAERQQRRSLTEVAIQVDDTPPPPVQYPSLQPRWRAPTPGFRPSQATKQNRYARFAKTIPVVSPPRSTVKLCPDPVKKVTEDQLKVLDPTGARTRLFSQKNPDCVKPGDILLVRLKTGEPFAGVAINIRQVHSQIDWAVLLRNHLTRIPVEMWVKIYSPNVEGIEIVQRKAKRARRAKLYYMRKPKHDMGSLENIVRSYLRTKSGQVGGARGRGTNAQKKKSKKK